MGKNIKSYIKNIQDDFGYASQITVEHRSNNSKRDFLFCNRIQGKHIPASPIQINTMVEDLVKQIKPRIEGYKVAVVGFAETATCLGNIVAEKLNCSYVMQTTREDCSPHRQLIEFEEEHSHATEQKLYGKLHKLSYADYILFVEDEISTGKTILNFIDKFKQLKPGLKYGVASICNWQTPENRQKFADRNIDVFALVLGEIADINAKMDTDILSSEDKRGGTSEKENYNIDITDIKAASLTAPTIKKPLLHFLYERTGHKYNDVYYTVLEINIARHFHFLEDKTGSVLVLGTEEFMYIPYRVGMYLSSTHKDVKVHATTRSSIDIMKDPDEPGLNSKFSLHSAYDTDRNTYVYNLDKYDQVLVITDSKNDEALQLFINDITRALNSVGNRNKHIHIFRIL